MSIIEYDGINKIHPANWIGIRVYRQIRGWGPAQKYFNCRNASQRTWQRRRKEARELDRKWADRQTAAKNLHYRHLSPSGLGNPLSATEVLAIRIDWSVYYRDGYKYIYPRFQITPTIDGQLYVRQTHVRTDETITDAWHRAIEKYGQLRGLSRRQIRELRKRPAPTAADFNKLRLHKNRTLHHGIPKHKVPRDQ